MKPSLDAAALRPDADLPRLAKSTISQALTTPLAALRPLPAEKQELQQESRRVGRRKLADILHGIRLDVVYRRAAGAYLEYRRDDGQTVQVLDLLSGYGAGLLGHQPPALVAIARASLDEGLSMNAQASCRGWSSLLCSRLAALLREAAGKDYLIHLVNTGSEAAEAAVRHAEIARRAGIQEMVHKVEAQVQQLRAAWPQLDAAVRAGLEAKAQTMPALRQALTEERILGAGEDALPAAILRHARAAGSTRPVFFAMRDGYHGSGCAAAKLSHGERYRRGLEHTGMEVRFVDIENLPAFGQELRELRHRLLLPVVDKQGTWRLEEKCLTRAAGLFLEVVQGEGGIHPLPLPALSELGNMAKAEGVALIVDEIQTGLGRSGRLFAFEEAELKPDMVLLSKVLGGGMAKLAACAIARDHYQDDFSLQHISTFAEDDASSRIACGVLELLTDETRALLPQVRRLGSQLQQGFLALQQRWPGVLREVRGKGLMIGLEFCPQDRNTSPLLRALDAAEALGMTICGWLLHEEQLRVAPTTRHARTLRIQPSLCLGDAEVGRILQTFDRLCGLLDKGDVFALTAYLHGESSPPPEAVRSSVEVQHHGVGSLREFADRQLGTSYGVLHALPADPERRLPRVAFLGHPIDAHSVRGIEPQLAHLSDGRLQSMLDRMVGQPETYPQRRFRLTSATGAEVEAVILSWQPLPATWMRARRDRALRARLQTSIREAIDEAVDEGCEVIGFGAYTSIFTSSCADVRNERVRVTSGNGLTAGMADRALAAACHQQGIDMAQARVAVVGATGNIGMVHARLLADRVAELYLIGPPGSEPRLRALASDMHEHQAVSAALHWSTDPAAVARCPVVVSATNAPRPLFGAADLAPGPGVFLDVSVPSDLKPDALDGRPDILFLQGGVVQLPHGAKKHSRLELPGWHLPVGHSYACLAETLLLGLERSRRDFSCGPLQIDDVREILALADRHGFGLGMIEQIHRNQP